MSKGTNTDMTPEVETSPVKIDNTETTLPPLDDLEPLDGEYTEKKKSKKGPIIFGLCFAALAAVYGVGAYYYQDRIHYNTVANGKALGNLPVADAEKLYTEDYDSLQITLQEKERSEVLHLEDMNAIIDVGTQVQDIKDSQNPWLWFLDVYGTTDYNIKLNVSYDEAALTKTVDGLECFKEENVIAPKSAYIEAKENNFEIVPEELGNTVKKEELITAIEEAVTNCETSIDLQEKDLYKLPKYYADDDKVKEALEKANKYASADITYDFIFDTEKVGYKQIKDWIKISKKFKVSLDKEKIEDYLYDLAKEYNTMGRAKKFKTAYGNEITITEGDYGFKIYHDKETEALIKNIKAGETIKREPKYSYRAKCRNSLTDDIGDSYVEVSIGGQEVWLYIDGKCIMNSSCVTGDATRHHDTTKGIYALTYKTTDATLTGPNANGTTYASHVNYWMPFNGNQGLHDASWRDSFGGSIYKGNGSHGCVNLPYSAAATIYKYVDEGFPVIVH